MTGLPIEISYDEAVGIIALNDPGSANALDAGTVIALGDALRKLQQACRAIVLTGNGKAFCAGAKLTEAAIPRGPEHDAGAPLDSAFHPMMRQIAALRVPLITAVNGVAAGGGMALALSGDIVIASDAARFVPAFDKIGLVPDCGITRLLVSTIGRVRATQMLMMGDALSVDRAFELGLVNQIVRPDGLMDEALGIARRLAAGPTTALGLTRHLLWHAEEGTLDEALHRERMAQRAAGLSADHAEAIDAFLSKRKPVFNGA